MFIYIFIFCILVTILSICKCWVNEKTKNFRIIETILIVFSGISGFFALYENLPSPACPQVNEISFYAYGGLNSFNFYCEFYARNEGDESCELEKIEFLKKDTTISFLREAQFSNGYSGGGGGGGLYGGGGGGRQRKIVVSSSLPQSIPSTNQLLCFAGKGENPTAEVKSLRSSDAQMIDIKFHFRSKNKTFVIDRAVPFIIGCEVNPLPY